MTKISADRFLLNDWRRRWFSKTSRSSSHTIFPLFSLPLSSRSPFSGRMCVRTSPRFFPYCKRELKSVFILNIRAASVRCSPAWPHRGKTGLVQRAVEKECMDKRTNTHAHLLPVWTRVGDNWEILKPLSTHFFTTLPWGARRRRVSTKIHQTSFVLAAMSVSNAFSIHFGFGSARATCERECGTETTTTAASGAYMRATHKKPDRRERGKTLLCISHMRWRDEYKNGKNLLSKLF